MSQVVIREVASRKNGVNEFETCQRPVPHRDRHGAIQLDYRRRFGPQEDIVQAD